MIKHMMLECRNPVPCDTPLGPGYVWYVTGSGMLENDVMTIILCKDGTVKHFTSDQVRIWKNATFDIRGEPKPEESKPSTTTEFPF